jgi:hypothetical protein
MAPSRITAGWLPKSGLAIFFNRDTSQHPPSQVSGAL